MPFQKGQGGRPRGAKNKTTVAAKEAIATAFDELGGVESLIAWVKADPANERVFYGQVYPKLLPLQVAGDEENPLMPPVTRVIHTFTNDADSDR